MKKKILILVLMVLTSSVLFAQWHQSNGPMGGLVTQIETTGTKLMAKSGEGLLYYYDSTTEEWEKNEFFGEKIGPIVSSDSTVFLSDKKYGGVYRSENNGQNWEYQNLIFGYIICATHYDSTIYLGSPYGSIVRTINGTKNWNDISSGIEEPNVVCMVNCNKTVYASTIQGVYKIKNSDTIWTKTENLNYDIRCLNVVGSTIYAVTNLGIVYKLIDGENRWTKINDGFTSDPKLVFCTCNSSIFASSVDGIFEFKKGEINWNKVYPAFPGTGIERIAVKGKDVYLMKFDSGIYKYDENTGKWEMIGLPTSSVQCIAKLNSDLFAGLSYSKTFALYKSSDNGLSWENNDIIDPISKVEYLVTAESTLYAISGKNIYKSKDNGKNWTKSMINTVGLQRGFTNVGTTLFCFRSSTLSRSDDEGSSWVMNELPYSGSCLYSYDSVLYMGTIENGVCKSADLGKTWIDINKGIDTAYIITLSVKDSIMYASTNGNGVYKSTNGGNSWIKTSCPDSKVSALAFSGSSIYAGTNAMGVYKSDDEGVTWNQINDGLWDLEIHNIMVDGKKVFVCTQNAGVQFLTELEIPKLITQNNSETNINNDIELKWNSVENISNYRIQVSQTHDFTSPIINEVVKSLSKSLIGLSGNSKYFWRVQAVDSNFTSSYSEIYTFTTKNNPNSVENNIPTTTKNNKFIISSINPNPVEKNISFDLTNSIDLTMSISVVDAAGREVAKLVDGQLQRKGTETYNFNLGDILSCGAYLLVVTAGDQTAVQTFTVVK